MSSSIAYSSSLRRFYIYLLGKYAIWDIGNGRRKNSVAKYNSFGEKCEEESLLERRNEIRRTRSTLKSFPLNPHLTSGIRYSRQIPIFVGHFADEVARNDAGDGSEESSILSLRDFDFSPEIFLRFY